MVSKQALSLNLLRREDLAGFHWFMLALALAAAVLSPRPLWLVGAVIMLYSAAWTAGKFAPRPTNAGCTLLIKPDDTIWLFSENGLIGQGECGKHAWCGQRLAVLSVTVNDRAHRCAVLASRQNAEDFRRLRVWIRHGICNNTS